MKTLLAVLSATVAAAAFADTFTWTGAADAYWTNAANWMVSGDVATRAPGALRMADTDAMWAGMDADTDTVIFDGTGVNPEIGYIDLDGHLSVKTVIFRGADAPAYVFGKASATPTDASAQRLALPPSGSMTFEQTLGTPPTFTTGLRLVQGCKANTAATTILLVNDSAVEFDMGKSWGQPDRRDPTDGSAYYVYINFSGTGSFAFGSHSAPKDIFCAPTFTQLGSVRVYGTTGTCSYFTVDKADGSQMVFNLEENGVVSIKQHGWATFTAKSDVLFTGTGKFQTYDASTSMLSPTWSIASGKAVTIDCPFSVVGGNSQFWNLNGSNGKLVFTADMPDTSYSKPTQLRGGTLETARIGMAGDDSPLGTGTFFFGAGSRLAYIGAGETTDRTFCLTNFSTSVADTTARLSQRGTGDWTVGGVIDLVKPGKTDTLILENDTEFAATLANPLADGEGGMLAVTKTGTGTWTISGENTYTGATTLEGGTLALDASQTIASLVVNGEAALAIADGVTVTVSALSRTTGTLDVQMEDSGRLIVAGAEFGAAPAWITVNGGAANVQADGTISAADHTWTSTLDISAHGGIIPETATADDVVGITTDGEGEDPITLEAAAGASIKGLVQKTEADATVALAEGQTLSAALLAVEPTAGSLTIGENGTVGAFAVPGSLLTLDAGNPDSTLTIAAPFEKAGKTLSKTGEGTAVVALAAGEKATGSVAEGTLAFAAGTSSLAFGADEGGFANFSAEVDAGGTVQTVNWTSGSTSPLVLGGTSAEDHRVKVNSNNGRIDIRGSNTLLRVSTMAVRPATDALAVTSRVEISDGAYVALDGNNCINVGGYNRGSGSEAKYKVGRGELTVSNATLATSAFPSDSWQTQDHGIFLGNDWGPGIMRVEEGAVVTNRLVIGRWSWYGYPDLGTGAYYQYGGTARLDAQVGLGRYGYMEINGGQVDFTSATIGNFNANGGDYRGSGVLVINGGTVNSPNGFTLGASNNNNDHTLASVMYVAGGTVKCGQHLYFGNYNSANTIDNFTIAGGYFNIYYVTPYGNTNPIFLNMNGGQMEFSSFYGSALLRPGAVFYMNFNGGIWHPTTGANTTLSAGTNRVSRLTVYEKGLTFDSDGFNNSTLETTFQSAPGKGVWSVPLPEELRTKRLIGAPTVTITGDGAGASAVALFDSRKGVVTNVVVTSHGWNYTTATASFRFRECSACADVTCGLQDNVRGKLTFVSPVNGRTMTLKTIDGGTNGFAGVCVKSGKLIAGTAGAIPEGVELNLEGGTLDMKANALVFDSLSGTGGTLQGTATDGKLVVTTTNPGTGLKGVMFKDTAGTTVPLKQSCNGAWTVDVADLAAGKTVAVSGEFAFGEDATLTITGDVTQLDPGVKYDVFEATSGAFEGMPAWTNAADYPQWVLKKVGGKIRFSKPKGMLLLVR